MHCLQQLGSRVSVYGVNPGIRISTYIGCQETVHKEQNRTHWNTEYEESISKGLQVIKNSFIWVSRYKNVLCVVKWPEKECHVVTVCVLRMLGDGVMVA